MACKWDKEEEPSDEEYEDFVKEQLQRNKVDELDYDYYDVSYM